MHWKKKKKVSDSAMALAYERLAKSSAKKGYVPLLVGRGNNISEMERFSVKVKFLNKPGIKDLLDKAALEFGYSQEGILRIPCDIDHFKQVMGLASKERE